MGAAALAFRERAIAAKARERERLDALRAPRQPGQHAPDPAPRPKPSGISARRGRTATRNRAAQAARRIAGRHALTAEEMKARNELAITGRIGGKRPGRLLAQLHSVYNVEYSAPSAKSESLAAALGIGRVLRVPPSPKPIPTTDSKKEQP